MKLFTANKPTANVGILALLAGMIFVPFAVAGSSTAAFAGEDEPEIGATFTITIPSIGEETPAPGSGGDDGSIGGGGDDGGSSDPGPVRQTRAREHINRPWSESKVLNFATEGGTRGGGGRASCGAGAWSVTVIDELLANGSYHTIGYTCNFPSEESKEPVTRDQIVCYYNFSGHYAFSENRSAIESGGTIMGNRPNLSSDPNPPSPASGRSANSPAGCNTDQNRVWWKTNAGDYGYYRISVALSYKVYTQWGWPAWMNRAETWWEAGGQQSGAQTNYYTYSCSATDSAFEGPMAHRDLPAQGARQFDVNQCPQVTWQCVVDGNPNINTPWDAPTTIMRDGNKVNVFLPGMRIDGSGVRNFNGTNTGVSDNDMQYLTSVSPGSTPMNGTDLNGGRQYFKLFKTNGASEKFDTWYSNPNANRNKQMEFYWASTSPSQAFSLTWNARFKAQFLVPRADTVGGGSSLQWVGDNATCPNLPITGNKASVVRSTASQSLN